MHLAGMVEAEVVDTTVEDRAKSMVEAEAVPAIRCTVLLIRGTTSAMDMQ